MKRYEYGENGGHRRVGITEQGGIWGEETKTHWFPTLSHYNLRLHRH